MDPRFSFSDSYPVKHPIWKEAIRNSKIDHAIKPIGDALTMLYGPIPTNRPKEFKWFHKWDKIHEYILNDLCDFTVRVSLLSKELAKADYMRLLEWICALRNQYYSENRPEFAHGDEFTYILRGGYNHNFRSYIISFIGTYGLPNKDKDGVWHPKQEVSYQDAFDLYRFWRIGTFRGDLLGKCEKNMKKWVDLLAQEVDLFHFSSEWARHSLNESDLTTMLISLEEADFHGASSLSDFASQAEAKDNVEFEQSEKLTFVRPSSTAQAEAEDSDEESIDSIVSLGPSRWSMRVWKRKHECMLASMSV
jgi:hypothetical protein